MLYSSFLLLHFFIIIVVSRETLKFHFLFLISYFLFILCYTIVRVNYVITNGK